MVTERKWFGKKFTLGMIVATSGVNTKMVNDDAFDRFIGCSLSRHINGDWGDLCEEDKKENEFSLNEHLRLLSSYTDSKGTKIWIITEADRSATTILFPDEY